MAEEFLARDVENILRYFRKYIEILPTADEVLARIRGDKRE
jgi:serine/threonine-protein kinase RIO1